jgi:hypothetical protein
MQRPRRAATGQEPRFLDVCGCLASKSCHGGRHSELAAVSRREPSDAETHGGVPVLKDRLVFGPPPGSFSHLKIKKFSAATRQHQHATRFIMRMMVCACHRAPVGVGIPRAVNCAAICRADKPELFNSDAD